LALLSPFPTRRSSDLGALLRHRRRRADPDAPVLLDAARPRGEGGLMAIALERSAVVPQRAKRHRIWRGLGHALTYLGLATALVRSEEHTSELQSRVEL